MEFELQVFLGMQSIIFKLFIAIIKDKDLYLSLTIYIIRILKDCLYIYFHLQQIIDNIYTNVNSIKKD